MGIIFNSISIQLVPLGEGVIGLGQRSPTSQRLQRLIDAECKKEIALTNIMHLKLLPHLTVKLATATCRSGSSITPRWSPTFHFHGWFGASHQAARSVVILQPCKPHPCSWQASFTPRHSLQKGLHWATWPIAYTRIEGEWETSI